MFRSMCALGLSAALIVSQVLPAHAELEWRGMAVGLWHVHPDTSYAEHFQEIRNVGGDAILFPIMVWVESMTDTLVYTHPERTAPDVVVRRAIREAHANGHRVVLMPIVRIAHRAHREWRGRLDPVNRKAFFASYEQMIVHYAQLAEAERVELFLLGSELSSLEHAREWEGIIQSVRAAYCGTVSYSANWDHYKQVWFWDQLDLIALTGYYELTKDPNASEEELTQSWGEIRETLLEWKKNYPAQRFVFTELGYPSQDGCAITPWDYTLNNAIDLEEQRRCYAAFVNTWQNDPSLSGVFFYEWSRDGGPQHGGYSPKGKPAAEVLEDYFLATE